MEVVILKQLDMEPSMNRVSSRKGITSIASAFIATAMSIMYGTPCQAAEIPDYYSEPGINPYRSYVNQDFAEHIDPFTGKLQLHYADLYLPGDGGFDFKVQRSYTSLDESLPSSTGTSILGMGWEMSFGLMAKTRTLNGCAYDSTTTNENPVMTLADGSREVFVIPNQGSSVFGGSRPDYISKNRWIANCIDTSTGVQWEVFSPDGTRYELSKNITSSTHNIAAVRSITDTNGNSLSFDYYGDSDLYSAYNLKPFVKKITASDGRIINFTYYDTGSVSDPNPLGIMRLKSISANGRTTNYDYKQVENTNHYRLTRVDLPGSNSGSWVYTYHVTDSDPEAEIQGKYSVESVTYPYGGRIRYTYDRNYYVQNDSMLTNGVKTKRTYDIGNTAIGNWSYSYTPGYASYLANQMDKTTVTMPSGVVVYHHYGLQSAGPDEVWRIGMLKKKIICESGSSCSESAATQVEDYTWDYQSISEENFAGPRMRVDGDIRAPILTRKVITRDGSVYETNYSNFDNYGNAQRVEESGDGNKTTLHKFYRNSGNWIINQVEDETVIDAVAVDGVLVDSVVNRTFDGNGNLRSEINNGVETSYTYDGDGNLATKTDARIKTTTYEDYHRGIARTEKQPEGVTINRTVYDTGTVESVTNGEGDTTSFGYDDLNRLSSIDYPINGDVVIVRTENTKTLDRGDFEQHVVLDGFGREKSIGNADTNSNPGISVTVTKRYDALGRKIFESYPNSPDGTTYTYDALDRLDEVIHTDGSSVKYNYMAGNRVQITDERNIVTVKQYRSYGDPGEKTLVRIESPEDVITKIARNRLGLVSSIWQGNSAPQGSVRYFRYDSRFFVKEEDNPETGTTYYGRDEVGNMTSKRVGSSGPTITYQYDDLDRLDFIDYPSPTPDVDYIYDKNSNVKEVTNSTSRRILSYDENENLTKEDILIDGNLYPVKYDYDFHDNLGAITYPTGRVAVYEPDALGRPTMVEPFISSVTYHPSGQPNVIHYNNGQIGTVNLNDRRWIQSIKSQLGTVFPVDLVYAYDYAGNVDYVNNMQDASYSRDMEYDGLNRLNYVDGVWGRESYTYTETGDIKTIIDGINNKTFSYANNRLANVTDQVGSYSYGYDDYGNITENSTYNFYYDDAQNLTLATPKSGGSSFLFDYDGNNMRVVRDKDGRKTHYVYTAAGQLLGAYYGEITQSEEYFYLGNEKVASAEIEQSIGTVSIPDITVYEGEQVTLDGGTVFSNGLAIDRYQWSVVSGPKLSLQNSAYQSITFTAPSGYSDYTLTIKLGTWNQTSVIGSSDFVRVHVKMVDTDGDALSDFWETEHYGGITVVSADSDTDGDGLTSMDEFEAGTDPASATTPQAAQKVTAVPGDTSAVITWRPGLYALSYDIYWSDTPGVTIDSGTKLENVTSPYHHSGLINGKKYYYLVVSRNDCCESASIEVSVVPGVNGWTTPTIYHSSEANSGGYIDQEFKTISSDYQGNENTTSHHSPGYIAVESYNHLQGWGKTAVIAEENESGLHTGPLGISSGNNGVAIALWQQSGNIIVKHYDKILGWGEQYSWALGDAEANIDFVRVKHHGDGNAIILAKISYPSTNSTRIYTIDYRPTTKWSSATLVKEFDSQFGGLSDFVVSDSGHMALFFMLNSVGSSDRSLNMMKRSTAGIWSDVTKISDHATSEHGAASINNHGHVAVAFSKTDYNTTHYSTGYENRLHLWGDNLLPADKNIVPISAYYSDYEYDWDNADLGTVIDDQGRITVAWMPSIMSWSEVQFPGDEVDESTECNYGREIAQRIYYKQYTADEGWGEEQRVVANWPEDSYCHAFLPFFALTADSTGDVHILATAINKVLRWTEPDPDLDPDLDPEPDTNPNMDGEQHRAFFDYVLKYEEGIRYQNDIYSWYPSSSNGFSDKVAYGDEQGNMLAMFREKVDGFIYSSMPVFSEFVRLPDSPEANAGVNQEAYGLTTVNLDGSTSAANASSITSYSWRQVHGVSVSLSDDTSVSPSFEAPVVLKKETLWFELTVTNSNGLSDRDTVSVTLYPETSNIVPDVGSDIIVNKGATVSLDASATPDPNDVITTVHWIQAAYPYVELTALVSDQNYPDKQWSATFTAPDVEEDTILTFKARIKDAGGRVVYGYKKVTVKADSTGADTIPPTVNPAADLTVEATAILTPVDLGEATAVDDIDGALTPTAAPAGPYALGTHTITWSATDAAGNTGTAQQTLTVQDTTAPTLTAPADISVASNDPIAVTLGSATATDIFEPVTVTNDAPALFPAGATTVIWTATDPNGNLATAQQTVTVTAADTTPPVVTAPPNISMEATATFTPLTLGMASAVDDVDGELTPTSDTSGPFALGTSSVTWSATDAAGNTGTAIQQVEIVDTTPPTITPPGDVTVEAYIPTVVDIGTATASDIFTPVQIENDAPAEFNPGATAVTWTATDANGNVATATQTVTVAEPSTWSAIIQALRDLWEYLKNLLGL